DDPVEAGKQVVPEPRAARRPPRKQVVRGEDQRPASAEEPPVEGRGGEPLDVEDVAALREQPRGPERVLEQLEGDAQARAPEEPRRDRVEELAPAVADLAVRGDAETKRRGHQLD